MNITPKECKTCEFLTIDTIGNELCIQDRSCEFALRWLEEHDKQIRAKVIDEIVEDISREYPECNYVADWVERLKENK